MGVEIDARRKPVAYHLYKNHPNDLGTGQSNETIRVPADEVIHAFIRQRPEQTRGYPFVASVMSNIKMLNGYYEAEIVAARVSSAKMVSSRLPLVMVTLAMIYRMTTHRYQTPRLEFLSSFLPGWTSSHSTQLTQLRLLTLSAQRFSGRLPAV